MTEQRILPNGVRVLAERMEGLRSVAVGVWFNAGSVYEPERTSGVSHFVEHMLFKGTRKRNASDIAAEMDAIGANLNAFTAKECTCFHVTVLEEHLEQAVELLADITQNSVIDPDELEREKQVILEEIAMTEDSAEDLVFERAGEQLFFKTPLEREILGSAASVGALTRDDLLAYMQTHYTGENLVIAAAGSLSPDTLFALAERYFSDVPRGTRQKAPAVTVRHGLRCTAVEKDAEQIHLCLSIPGAALGTDAFESLAVLSNALGGGMSSRLFRSIREERGLAYSVYSQPIAYRGAGSLYLYAGCTEHQAEEALRLMLDEADGMRKDGLEAEEFARAKQQLIGNYLLNMESAAAHMSAIGKSALLLDRIYELETTLNRMNCVTIEAVKDQAADLFSPKAAAFCAAGRLKGIGGTLEAIVQNRWNARGS